MTLQGQGRVHLIKKRNLFQSLEHLQNSFQFQNRPKKGGVFETEPFPHLKSQYDYSPEDILESLHAIPAELMLELRG